MTGSLATLAMILPTAVQVTTISMAAAAMMICAAVMAMMPSVAMMVMTLSMAAQETIALKADRAMISTVSAVISVRTASAMTMVMPDGEISLNLLIYARKTYTSPAIWMT